MSFALCLFALVHVNAIDPIIARGNQLFDAVSKKRHYVKGLAYAPGAWTKDADSLEDPSYDYYSNEEIANWTRDIANMKELGVNTIRLYTVDPSKNHTLFMKACEAAGIYVLVPTTTLNLPGALQSAKTPPDCYPFGLVASAREIVKTFSQYPNVLAFVVANEVALEHMVAIPCVKALARDLRAFQKSCSCSMRDIPLMYAGVDLSSPNMKLDDILTVRDIIADYLMCDADGDGAHVDMYGINVYSWCSATGSLNEGSTYGAVITAFKDTDKPFVFSEFGCAVGSFATAYPYETGQRTWKQVDTLLSPEMSDVMSGGLAFQYSMGAEKIFGLVLLPGYAPDVTELRKLDSFTNLKGKYTTLDGPAGDATWGDEDFCTWVPKEKTPRGCPSNDQVQAAYAKYNTAKSLTGSSPESTYTPAWNIIPPNPLTVDTAVTCPDYSLPAEIKKQNGCNSDCECDADVTDSTCRVDYYDNFYRDVFTRMAALDPTLEDTFKKEIDSVQPGKVYGCSNQWKADYILSSFKAQTGTCLEGCVLQGEEPGCTVQKGSDAQQIDQIIGQTCGAIEAATGSDYCGDTVTPQRLCVCEDCNALTTANYVLKYYADTASKCCNVPYGACQDFTATTTTEPGVDCAATPALSCRAAVNMTEVQQQRIVDQTCMAIAQNVSAGEDYCSTTDFEACTLEQEANIVLKYHVEKSEKCCQDPYAPCFDSFGRCPAAARKSNCVVDGFTAERIQEAEDKVCEKLNAAGEDYCQESKPNHSESDCSTTEIANDFLARYIDIKGQCCKTGGCVDYVEDADCKGDWSLSCNANCQRDFTQTQAQSGNGAACPTEPPSGWQCTDGLGSCVEKTTGGPVGSSANAIHKTLAFLVVAMSCFIV